MEVERVAETEPEPQAEVAVLPAEGELEAVEQLPTLEWRPRGGAGTRIGAAALTMSLVCSALVLNYATSHPIAIDSFIAAVAGLAGLLLAFYAALLVCGCRSLRYSLSSSDLTISWLWIREVVPLGLIEGVFGGHRFGKRIDVDGFSWPGHYVGRARAEGLGRLKFYGTTNAPDGAIIVATTVGGYALTPSDLEGFRERLIERLESVPVEEIEGALEARTEMPRLLRLSILRDGVALFTMAAAVLILVGSFGYVSARFPGLPELMPLHYNFAGEPDLIGPPRDAFRMPIIGLMILAANGAVAIAVHGWRRPAGRILALATVFVELVMLMAVVRVVH